LLKKVNTLAKKFFAPRNGDARPAGAQISIVSNPREKAANASTVS